MWERGENLYLSEVSRHCIIAYFVFTNGFYDIWVKAPFDAQFSQIYRFGKAGRVKKIRELNLLVAALSPVYWTKRICYLICIRLLHSRCMSWLPR